MNAAPSAATSAHRAGVVLVAARRLTPRRAASAAKYARAMALTSASNASICGAGADLPPPPLVVEAALLSAPTRLRACHSQLKLNPVSSVPLAASSGAYLASR